MLGDLSVNGDDVEQSEQRSLAEGRLLAMLQFPLLPNVVHKIREMMGHGKQQSDKSV